MATAVAGTWLAREQERLQHDNPRLWSTLRASLRFRIPAMVFVAALSGGLMQLQSMSISDTALFVHAGRQMVSADWLNVFRDPALQVGPVYLLLLGVLGVLADLLHLPAAFVDGFVQAGLVSGLCLYLVRASATDGGLLRERRDLGIGISLIFGPLAVVGAAGHFEEPLIAGLLLLAAVRAKQGRVTSVALLVALASGLKLWGLLGVPILLMAAPLSVVVKRTAVFALAVLALYLPFFAWGQVNAFTFRWPVWPSATISLFVHGQFTWQYRAAQALATCFLGAAMALRKKAPAWATPVVLIAGRLLLDPEQVPYYWCALALCLMVGAWAGVERRWVPVLLVSTLGAFAALGFPYVADDVTNLVVHTTALVGLLAVMFSRRLAR